MFACITNSGIQYNEAHWHFKRTNSLEQLACASVRTLDMLCSAPVLDLLTNHSKNNITVILIT